MTSKTNLYSVLLDTSVWDPARAQPGQRADRQLFSAKDEFTDLDYEIYIQGEVLFVTSKVTSVTAVFPCGIIEVGVVKSTTHDDVVSNPQLDGHQYTHPVTGQPVGKGKRNVK